MGTYGRVPIPQSREVSMETVVCLLVVVIYTVSGMVIALWST